MSIHALGYPILGLGALAFFFGKTKDVPWLKHLLRVLAHGVIAGLICFGTGALFWIASESMGFLPYSDRPGPGWILRPGIPGLNTWLTALNWLIFALEISIPTLAALSAISVFADKFAVFRIARVPLEVILYGYFLFLSAAAAGWYQALNVSVIYSVAIGGLIFGFLRGMGYYRPGKNAQRVALVAIVLGVALTIFDFVKETTVARHT